MYKENHQVLLIFLISLCVLYIPSASTSSSEFLNAVSTDSHGWDADEDYNEEYGILPDDVVSPDIVYTITDEEFRDRYLHKKPFILRDPSRSAELRSMTSKSKLLSDYGKVKIRLGTQHELAAGGKGSRKTTLKKFIKELPYHRKIGSIPELNTFFDRHKFLKKAKAIAKMMSIPMNTTATMEKIFTIGDSGSGLAFHVHNDAWNEVLAGRKRWSLYSPGSVTRLGCNPSHRHAQWVADVLPQVDKDERPLEFVQEVGDMVYVPEGWHHATVNIGETVAYALQSPDADTPCMVEYQAISKVEDSDPTRAVSHAHAALKACGDESYIYNQLGILYTREDVESNDGPGIFPNWQKARDSFQRAVDLNPRMSSAYKNLALATRNTGCHQSDLDGIREQAEKYGANSRELEEVTSALYGKDLR